MSKVSKSKPFKACRSCRALVDKDAETCPNCGSKDFSDEWEGVVIVIEPESSEIAKVLEIKSRGRFVAKLE
ncbi:MAG: transcription elongation factor subunit Spt4 [Desulfurococcaceae archaeon]